MAFIIDTSTLDFNAGGSGFTVDYVVPTLEQQPVECTVPALNAANLGLPATTLTPVDVGCSYDFQAILPPPPPYIPKIVVPNIPCPQGIVIDSAITVVGSGSAIVSGGIEVINENCTWLLGGGLNIFVPEIPCPGGMSFSGNASITTSGIATGGGTIQLIGGPCNYELVGNINITVPPPPGSGGGGPGPGTFQSCPISPSLTVADLFTTDGSGNPILNFPSMCSDCNASNAGPFTMVNPTFGDINIKTATTASCCSVTNDSILDLCGGVLALDDNMGNTNQITGGAITMVGSGITVIMDSSATSGQNVSFQAISVCVGGVTKSMIVLGSVPF